MDIGNISQGTDSIESIAINERISLTRSSAPINAAVMCSVYDVKFDKSVAANLLLSAALVSLVLAVFYILNFLFRNPNTAVFTFAALLCSDNVYFLQ